MSVAALPIPFTTQFTQCNWTDPKVLNTNIQPTATDTTADENAQPCQLDIWTAIQSRKVDATTAPYVHPLVRRSSSMLSQESLEICTESLGSENGSSDFSTFLDLEFDTLPSDGTEQKVLEAENGLESDGAPLAMKQNRPKQLTSVNYHCSIGRRSPARSFPPPLPSISRRDGPCLHMKPHRRDGRLIVEAVAVPSKNYLHAQREDGRLLLCFIDAGCNDQVSNDSVVLDGAPSQDYEEQSVEEDDDEEEEVEVVDRGTVVEVKVSSQPQQQHGAVKVHRSSLVINKFVGGTPSNCRIGSEVDAGRSSGETKQQKTTAAAAVVAATTVSVATTAECYGGERGLVEERLLFTSKLRSRGELLHSMKSCSELRRPLFIWEPCCIATTS